jgi:hypothetical protein
MNLSSMAQDVYRRKSALTELDDLSGEILRTADQYHVPRPSTARLRLCSSTSPIPTSSRSTSAPSGAKFRQKVKNREEIML